MVQRRLASRFLFFLFLFSTTSFFALFPIHPHTMSTRQDLEKSSVEANPPQQAYANNHVVNAYSPRPRATTIGNPGALSASLSFFQVHKTNLTQQRSVLLCVNDLHPVDVQHRNQEHRASQRRRWHGRLLWRSRAAPRWDVGVPTR